MKVLEAEIDIKTVENNLEELSDLIRVMINKKDPSLLKKLAYDNDFIFREPCLFFHFLEEKSTPRTASLEQVLWGYMDPKTQEQTEAKVFSDTQGLINLPNYGYLVATPSEAFILKAKDGEIYLQKGTQRIKPDYTKDIYIEGTSIRLCMHEAEMLTNRINVEFNEKIGPTTERFTGFINKGYKTLQDISPAFCKAVELTTREVCIFNTQSLESLASIAYYGTAFLNVQNQDHDEIFFIDDISHQCGHIIFYALTLDTSKYLKVPQNTMLKSLTFIDWETRNVYGVFHGLFTYTTIIDALTKCLELKLFKGKQLHELLARLGFYMSKFVKDLASMNNTQILTNEGFDYFDMFKAGYDKVYDRYKHVLRELNYTNQNYIFSYSKFAEINSLNLIENI